MESKEKRGGGRRGEKQGKSREWLISGRQGKVRVAEERRGKVKESK